METFQTISYERIPSDVFERETTLSNAIANLRETNAAFWDPGTPKILRSYLIQNKLESEQKQVLLAIEQEQNLTVDELTGLNNKASFNDKFDSMIIQSARNNRKLQLNSGVTMMFVDLDGFKAINDNIGHAAGDEVLKEVATRIRSSIRDYDSAHRFGGDEFAILLSDLDYQDIESKIEDLKDDIKQDIVLESGQPVTVGASFGFVYIDSATIDSLSLISPSQRGEQLRGYIHTADCNMYADKIERRANR